MQRPLVSGEQMQAIERAHIERGLSSLALMEVASRAVAEVAEARFDPRVHREIVALAGPGNNGGDAIAAARLLRDRGLPVRAVQVGGRATGDLAHQIRLHGAVHSEVPDIADHVLVIDGLFGTGLARELTSPYAELVARLANAALHRVVVAVDIPSGVHAATGQVLGIAVRADVTVTFQVPKLGHYLYPGRAQRGALVVADIGLPLSDFAGVRTTLAGDELVEAALPDRAPVAHKGTHGHLLVVAGQPERPGSALLAARAALRTGAGLVSVASDAETIARIAPALDELMGHDVGAPRIDAARVEALYARKTALVIGPSLDERDDYAVRTILHQAPLPVVIDAGALHTVAADPSVLRARSEPTFLTPHPGEMAALTGTAVPVIERDRIGAATRCATDLKAYVVLKGASTVVAAPDGAVALIPSGNPGMATAGMGDVLAGVLGGLLAQHVEPWLAARAAAYLHGRAGDLARDVHGETSLVASDLLGQLGAAITAAKQARTPWPGGLWPPVRRDDPRGYAP